MFESGEVADLTAARAIAHNPANWPVDEDAVHANMLADNAAAVARNN